MREFFRDWRRKLGCVMLVFACGLMGMWVRSFQRRDCFVASIWDFHYQWKSFGGVTLIERTTPDSILPNWHWSQSEVPDEWCLDAFLQSVTADWKWREFHFRSGIIRLQGGPNEFWYLIMPYWSLTLPVTLLSAWLLLSKPPQPITPSQDHA
jgi:hypothetical protein